MEWTTSPSEDSTQKYSASHRSPTPNAKCFDKEKHRTQCNPQLVNQAELQDVGDQVTRKTLAKWKLESMLWRALRPKPPLHRCPDHKCRQELLFHKLDDMHSSEPSSQHRILLSMHWGRNHQSTKAENGSIQTGRSDEHHHHHHHHHHHNCQMPLSW